MRKLFLALCTAAASTAAMADHSKLVMSGDSMSDTHRLFEISKTLHMIWTGPDDFYRPNIGMNSATVHSALGNIKQAVHTLYAAGARHFFIPLMPDLSLRPSARNHETLKPG